MQRVPLHLVHTAARRSRALSQLPRSSPACSRGPLAWQLRSRPATTSAPPGAAAAQKAPAAPASGASPATAAEPAAAAESVAAGGAGAAKMPDINSTTLGIEDIPDPHTNDPLKWKKFLWKYAGAVVVFLCAYKAVSYYVDKLDAEGKRQREEVEENKALRKQFEADQEKARQMLSQAQSPADAVRPAGAQMPGALPNAQGAAGDAQQQQAAPMSLFTPIQEEEGFVSELDELRTLQVELQAKLKALSRERKQTDETMNRKWELEGELKDLEREMEELERAEATR